MLLHLYSLKRVASMTLGDTCNCDNEESLHEAKKRLMPYLDRVVAEAETVAPCLASIPSLSKSQRVLASGIIEDAAIRLYKRDSMVSSNAAAVQSQTVGEYTVSFDAARPLLGFSSSGSVFNAGERKQLRRLCGGCSSNAYTVSMIGDGGCDEGCTRCRECP